jgi:hypothetical protein
MGSVGDLGVTQNRQYTYTSRRGTRSLGGFFTSFGPIERWRFRAFSCLINERGMGLQSEIIFGANMLAFSEMVKNMVCIF